MPKIAYLYQEAPSNDPWVIIFARKKDLGILKNVGYFYFLVLYYTNTIIVCVCMTGTRKKY